MNTSSAYSLDDVLIGSTYMLLITIIAFLYVPCLYVIGFDSELKNHPCLKLMFHLGVCDLLQMSGQFIYGFWAMTGIGYTVSFWTNRIIVAFTSDMGWQIYIVLLNLLALNRCLKLSFISSRWHDMVFGKTTTKIWIALAWIQGSFWFSFRLSPWIREMYNPYMFVNMLDHAASPLAWLLVRMSWWHCFINEGLAVVWYGIAIIAMRLQTHQLDEISEETRKSEKALMKQAIIICVTLILADQYWHMVIYWSFDILGIYAGAVGLYLLKINYAVNPIIYLLINKTISEKVRKLIPFGKNNEVTTVKTSKVTRSAYQNSKTGMSKTRVQMS